jgi:hypothetical protein
MSNFYQRQDVSAVNQFTDAPNPIAIGFESSAQGLVNQSDIPIEVSFDGVNVHGRLEATGPSQGLSFDDQRASKIWIRRAGAGAGTKNLDIYAQHR